MNKTTNMNNQQPKQQIQIKINDEVLKGSYANATRVSHSKEEFVLDFLNLFPVEKHGIVTARVITSPGHLKRFIAALSDNLKKYESTFGKIEEADKPTEIGFQDKE